MQIEENKERILVEVAYALPDKQTILSVKVNSSATILQIVNDSGILELYPEINIESARVGIFSKLAKLTDTLHAGDRIEIYRPLIADPKEVRKQRALKAKEEKK